MSLASSPVDPADAPLFVDGLGERIVASDAATGELLQVLRLRPALTAVPSFEFALRERAARLVNFRHAYYARVRRIDRVQANGSLAVISDHVEGTRLSDILRVVYSRRLQLDINAALCLVRQLVPAVALLHENARDASHGLIGPDRIIVTPHARLVIVEHVAGSAIEQLQFSRERLWQEFRVTMPSSAGLSRFDHRGDVNGIGVTALSLVLGRLLAADEFPHAIPGLLMQARERSPYGEERPLSNAFRNWLARCLQLDVRRAFSSATEALAGLEETLATDSAYVAAPVALETFLSQYIAAARQPASPAPPVLAAVPVQPVAAVVPPVVAPPVVPAAPPPAPPAAPAVSVNVPPPPAPRLVASAPRPRAAETPVGLVPALPPDDTMAAPPAAGLQQLPTLADLIDIKDLQSIVTGPREEAVAPAPAAKAVNEVNVVNDAPASPPAVFDFQDAIEEVRDEAIDQHPTPADEAIESAGAEAAEPVANSSGSRRSMARLAAVVALVVVLGGGAALAARYYSAAPAGLGTLIVQSSPAGVEVYVDGVSRGMTPARLSLPAGSHILELRGRGVPRVIPLQVPAGGQVSQYLEFADTPMTGLLVVHSQPAGAQVTVDGVARGVAPLTLEGMSPGDHEVVLQSEAGSSKHVVKVLAGTTASLVAPVIAPAAEGPVSGWISVKAPFTVEIRESGQLLGTTETDRLMLAAGRHVLEFANQTLGYKETRVVQVAPGKVASLSIELPKGTLHLNASPWAEVWIDGKRIGETPLGNVEVPIGAHEIVFRHPQFGERRHAVSVTSAAPVRLSVKMQ